MIDKTEFREFVDVMRAEIADESSEALSESLRVNRFTEFVAGMLVDFGVISDIQVTYFEKNGGQAVCNAWNLDLEEGRLDLVSAIFLDKEAPEFVSRGDIDKAVKRAIRVVEFAVSSRSGSIDPAHRDEYDFIRSIRDHNKDINQIRVFVITDGCFRDAGDRSDVHSSGTPIYISNWDVERVFKVCMSGKEYEPIEIDLLDRYGNAIECLAMPSNTSEYQGYLAIFPGILLAKLYDEFGSRLMELNVRSFLQQRGKVNKGIRETILSAPTRFLAFNNGISATVEAMDTERLESGALGIKRLKGLQIVNGGQTVASLHRAMKADKATTLDQVFVQAKISVISPEHLDALVPMISRFSNTQNIVNEADFSSNDPFHVKMEHLSETVWTPGEQYRWFYERARGQYEVARNRFGGTPSKRRVFDEQTPKSRKIAKTDLAKYLNAWAQLPFVIGQGGQKNFIHCMKRLEIESPNLEPDKSYFKRVIAKAIIYKKAESIARKLKLPGYRANAVAYTVSLIAFKTVERINLEKIWQDQDVSPALEKTIIDWMPDVWDEIVDSAGSKNVTEWAKRKECWEAAQLLDVQISTELEAELAEGDPLPNVGKTARSGRVMLSPDDREKIARVMQVDKEEWRRVSDWGQETGLLANWQYGIALTLSGYAAGRWAKVPSCKQARQGVEILRIAKENAVLDVEEVP